MSLILYDLGLLVIFLIFITVFLYKRKKNVQKEGLLLLYPTKWGIKLIEKVGKKYKKTLNVLSYISVGLGYLLMAYAVYTIGQLVWIYAFEPLVVQTIKMPPLMPLLPYVPQAFNINFLPPFYFISWIVIIAVIAIPHEFFHGIFAARRKVGVKKTGFGFFPSFFPVFLAAFVELDEKKMSKKKIFHQLSVLSAGTFANVLTGILFLFIFIGFFSLAYTPSGIMFDTYATDTIAIAGISAVNNISTHNMSFENIINLTDEESLNKIYIGEKEYLSTRDILEKQKDNEENIIVYHSAPAINARLQSVILKINDNTLTSIDDLTLELSKYSPGEKITLNLLAEDEEDYDLDIILEAHPENESKAWLGVGFYGSADRLISLKDSNTYYELELGELTEFIYNLLWWIILICISVAILNMIPMGIFDGGRFFYLTILGITKNKKIAINSYKFMTQLILFLAILTMILWAYHMFF